MMFLYPGSYAWQTMEAICKCNLFYFLAGNAKVSNIYINHKVVIGKTQDDTRGLWWLHYNEWYDDSNGGERYEKRNMYHWYGPLRYCVTDRMLSK